MSDSRFSTAEREIYLALVRAAIPAGSLLPGASEGTIYKLIEETPVNIEDVIDRSAFKPGSVASLLVLLQMKDQRDHYIILSAVSVVI